MSITIGGSRDIFDCIPILNFRADLQMTFLDLGVLPVLKVSLEVFCE